FQMAHCLLHEGANEKTESLPEEIRREHRRVGSRGEHMPLGRYELETQRRRTVLVCRERFVEEHVQILEPLHVRIAPLYLLAHPQAVNNEIVQTPKQEQPL